MLVVEVDEDLVPGTHYESSVSETQALEKRSVAFGRAGLAGLEHARRHPEGQRWLKLPCLLNRGAGLQVSTGSRMPDCDDATAGPAVYYGDRARGGGECEVEIAFGQRNLGLDAVPVVGCGCALEQLDGPGGGFSSFGKSSAHHERPSVGGGHARIRRRERRGVLAVGDPTSDISPKETRHRKDRVGARKGAVELERTFSAAAPTPRRSNRSKVSGIMWTPQVPAVGSDPGGAVWRGNS